MQLMAAFAAEVGSDRWKSLIENHILPVPFRANKNTISCILFGKVETLVENGYQVKHIFAAEVGTEKCDSLIENHILPVPF